MYTCACSQQQRSEYTQTKHIFFNYVSYLKNAIKNLTNSSETGIFSRLKFKLINHPLGVHLG